MLGDTHTLDVDSTVVSSDKKTVTLNLSETVAAMPEVAASDVKVTKRGEDASEAVASVTTTNKKIIVTLADALENGTEYEVLVSNKTFSGINGGTAAELKGYTYVNAEKTGSALPYSEDFEDGATNLTIEPAAGYSSAADYSSITPLIENYEGRGKVLVAKNTENALTTIGNTTGTSSTQGYENFLVYETLDSALNKNKKYVISYSQRLVGNNHYIKSGSTTKEYTVPKYGFAVSSRNELGNSPWRLFYQYIQGGANTSYTNGYLNVLAAGGTLASNKASKTVASYVSFDSTNETEKRRSEMVNSDVIKEYATTDDGYLRLNHGEWYDIQMVVDMKNNTVDYYYDGKYMGQQTSADGLDFLYYITKKTDTDGDGTKETITLEGGTDVAGIRTIMFGAAFGPKKQSLYSVDTIVPGEYMLDDISIEEFDGGKFDKYLKSVRFVDKQGNKSFSTATVSTLNNKIELTGENVASEAAFGAVTLTKKVEGEDVAVPFTPSYASGVYTLSLGRNLTGNTTYTLSALGESYTFTTDAGDFAVVSVQLSRVTGEGESEVVTPIDDISDIAVNDKIRSTVSIINTTGQPQSVWLPIAYYNNNILTGIKFGLLETDGTKTEDSGYAEIVVTDITGLKISGFAWDGTTKIKPLVKNVTLK